MISTLFKLLEVETTNYCNRNCWYCLFGRLDYHVIKNKMDDKLIDKIINELSELKYDGIVNWFSINEPLMDSRIYDIIRTTKKKVPRCKSRIFTNGDFLSQKTLDKLFKAGLWNLKVSLHDKRTEIKISKLDFEGKNVIFARYYNKKPEEFHNRAGDIEYLAEDVKPDYNCPRPSVNMVLRWDGKLKLCAEDMIAKTFDDSLNLNNYTLKELWFSKEMDLYRKKLQFGRYNLRTCSECNFIRSVGEGECQRVSKPPLLML